MNQKAGEFKPLHENEVYMYVCGLAVHNYPRIGNARSIVILGTLEHTFQTIGYNVKMVSNYIDVDDKIIKVAKKCGVSETEITGKSIDAYDYNRLSLHAAVPDAAPRVIETMDAIITFTKLLVDRGHACKMGGDVYFRVNSVESYGKLSSQQVEDLLVGAHTDEDSKKENPLGLTLWKKTEEGIKQDSPWSVGHPGWHTGCIIMIDQEFGGKHAIDIHGGGTGLRFPHHENEIAQSRAAHDSPVANYQIHNGVVSINGEKTFKSLGDVAQAKDIIAKIDGSVLRWITLFAHCRAPSNINKETIETARKELNCAATVMRQAYVRLGPTNVDMDEACDEEQFAPFLDAMQDDMNIPNAFAAVLETVRALNQALRQREIGPQVVKTLVRIPEKTTDVLDIEFLCLTMNEENKQLHRQWKAVAREKNSETADQYRAKLIEKDVPQWILRSITEHRLPTWEVLPCRRWFGKCCWRGAGRNLGSYRRRTSPE